MQLCPLLATCAQYAQSGNSKPFLAGMTEVQGVKEEEAEEGVEETV